MSASAGVSNWRAETPHSLRQCCIAALADDPRVNQKEAARLARHRSLGSQVACIRTNGVSRAAAFDTLANPCARQGIGNQLEGVSAQFPAQLPVDMSPCSSLLGGGFTNPACAGSVLHQQLLPALQFGMKSDPRLVGVKSDPRLVSTVQDPRLVDPRLVDPRLSVGNQAPVPGFSAIGNGSVGTNINPEMLQLLRQLQNGGGKPQARPQSIQEPAAFLHWLLC